MVGVIHANSTTRTEVAIAGGGIIGLALGLELRLRGMSVAVLERGQAMRAASWAAGGMLAVYDPQNPFALMPLARRSGQLYPDWLRRIEELSGLPVPMRTHEALQWVGMDVHDGIATVEDIRRLAPGLRELEGVPFRLLDEASVDPRDLCAALPKAFTAAGGRLLEGCSVVEVQQTEGGVRILTTAGEFAAQNFVNCCGAWAGAAIKGLSRIPVQPVKGQMVELHCPPEQLKCVVRSPHVYIIPRGDGRVTVGATIEHAGFDARVDDRTISGLIQAAQRLVPELALSTPPKSWAGLRPGTPDDLPVMGPALDPRTRHPLQRCWLATGHYRDGILLAPGTARVMAQAITGESTDLPLDPFTAARFL